MCKEKVLPEARWEKERDRTDISITSAVEDAFLSELDQVKRPGENVRTSSRIDQEEHLPFGERENRWEGISTGDFVRLLWSQYDSEREKGLSGQSSEKLTGNAIQRMGNSPADRETSTGNAIQHAGVSPVDQETLTGNVIQHTEVSPADREADLRRELRRDPHGLLEYGRQRGWLEPQDLLEAEKPLIRRQAARILHEFLRKECGEADEADWGSAGKLADLYDCRVCVNHVAQVYAKGIMGPMSCSMEGVSEPSERVSEENQEKIKIFGMEKRVSHREAAVITARTLDRKRRRKPEDFSGDAAKNTKTDWDKNSWEKQYQGKQYQKRPYQGKQYQEIQCQGKRYQEIQCQGKQYQERPYQGKRYQEIQCQGTQYQRIQCQGRQHHEIQYPEDICRGSRITKQEAENLLRKDKAPVFWDVRSREEYERGHLSGAGNVPIVNVPMTEILDAPEKWADSVGENGVILGCDAGYRSQIAADCLAEAGCREVYFLGWEAE